MSEPRSFRNPDTIYPVSYVGVRNSATGSARAMPPHSHHIGIEICYIVRGHIQWWIESISYELGPHDLIVTLPRHAHGTIDSSLQPCEYCWVHIYENAIPTSISEVFSVPGFEGIHRDGDQTGELILRIMAEHDNPDTHSRAMVEALVDILLSSLARDVDLQGASSPSLLVQKAQHALLDTFTEPPTVAEVARELGVSTVWLTKKFLEETGDSPGNWARNWRINEARRLLITEATSVGEIAMKLGFTSSQYFATVFRRETGMTPTEYRNIKPEYLGH